MRGHLVYWGFWIGGWEDGGGGGMGGKVGGGGRHER